MCFRLRRALLLACLSLSDVNAACADVRREDWRGEWNLHIEGKEAQLLIWPFEHSQKVGTEIRDAKLLLRYPGADEQAYYGRLSDKNHRLRVILKGDGPTDVHLQLLLFGWKRDECAGIYTVDYLHEIHPDRKPQIIRTVISGANAIRLRDVPRIMKAPAPLKRSPRIPIFPTAPAKAIDRREWSGRWAMSIDGRNGTLTLNVTNTKDREGVLGTAEYRPEAGPPVKGRIVHFAPDNRHLTLHLDFPGNRQSFVPHIFNWNAHRFGGFTIHQGSSYGIHGVKLVERVK